MIGAIGLTESDEKENSMEDNWLWYLSGAMDTELNISVKVSKDENLNLNHTIYPNLSFHRPLDTDVIFGMIDEYAQENGVKYRIDELKNSKRMVIENVDSSRRFLEPLVGGFIQQRERAEVFLDEFIPLLEDGPPESKKEFIEVMDVVNDLRRHPINTKKSKYTYRYFRDEWGYDLE